MWPGAFQETGTPCTSQSFMASIIFGKVRIICDKLLGKKKTVDTILIADIIPVYISTIYTPRCNHITNYFVVWRQQMNAVPPELRQQTRPFQACIRVTPTSENTKTRASQFLDLCMLNARIQRLHARSKIYDRNKRRQVQCLDMPKDKDATLSNKLY